MRTATSAARCNCPESRRCAATASASASTSPVAKPSPAAWPRAYRQRAACRSGEGAGTVRTTGVSAAHSGAQPTVPCVNRGTPRSAAHNAPSVRARSAGSPGSASRGPRTTPAPVRRASRAAIRASSGTSPGRRASAIASRTSGRSPAALRAAVASPAASPPRLRRWTRPTPVPAAAAVRWTSGVSAVGSSRASPSTPASRASGRALPSRCPVTRSGTANTLDSGGRSGSVTSTRPPAISGAPGASRNRAAAVPPSPHSSRARPTVGRRRVRSSLR
ncbi:hypothetical protein SHIRM173S_00537 [Streptomyces hirsutus]